MLSFNLRYFVDRTRRLCFTATANYTVVKDLHEQLDLDETGKDIICPIDLKKSNNIFNINFARSEDENLANVKNHINKFISDARIKRNKQMVVFTKDKANSEFN